MVCVHAVGLNSHSVKFWFNGCLSPLFQLKESCSFSCALHFHTLMQSCSRLLFDGPLYYQLVVLDVWWFFYLYQPVRQTPGSWKQLLLVNIRFHNIHFLLVFIFPSHDTEPLNIIKYRNNSNSSNNFTCNCVRTLPTLEGNRLAWEAVRQYNLPRPCRIQTLIHVFTLSLLHLPSISLLLCLQL